MPSEAITMSKNKLTPEIVRLLCRELGSSTNRQARNVEDACQRILDGQCPYKVIKDIKKEDDDE